MEKSKVKICPVCKSAYVGARCPVCNFWDGTISYKNGFLIICATVILIFCGFIKLFHTDSVNPAPSEIGLTKFSNKKPQASNYIEIKTVPMIELSGMTRDEIFNLRKNAVKKSKIFKIKNYEPNENVYQIEDNLPWISAEQISQHGSNPNIGLGASRSSFFILNPDFLIGFSIPYFGERKPSQYSEADYFHPYKLEWDKKNNTIYAHFDLKSFFKLNPYNYPRGGGINMWVDETNARDMGYEWIYAHDSNRVRFIDAENISTKPYKMQGYYHKGYNCGLKSGCNNYSPRQPYMYFYILNSGGYLKLKLWKKKPISKYQKADLIYEMYFD